MTLSSDDRDMISTHEAGHAVMRWLLGLPATEMLLHESGGLVRGTGRRSDSETQLLLALAGPAVESGYGLVGKPDFQKSDLVDFDVARAIIEGTPWLRHSWGEDNLSVDEALLYHFERACEQLLAVCDLVDWLGERLNTEGRLSARSVAAVCREFGKQRSGEV